VWDHKSQSGGQVAYRIGVREKESPENIGVRIHDPVKSEILDRSDRS
jgi:hypothetical protein